MVNVAFKLTDMSGSGKMLYRSIRQHTCRYVHRPVWDIGGGLVEIASRLVAQSQREW
jgi:hypothetical protein